MRKIVPVIIATLIAPTAHAFDIGGDTNRATAIAANSTHVQQRQGQAQGQLQGQHQSMSGGNVTVNDRLQAPAVSAPGFSSGHPCGIAPASFGLSIVGGALSAGGQRSDDACLLAQMGYKDAAMVMIAQRNGAARDALERTGHIATPAVSSRSAAPETVGVAYTTCKMDEGAIRVGVRRGADEATKARAVSECKASLR